MEYGGLRRKLWPDEENFQGKGNCVVGGQMARLSMAGVVAEWACGKCVAWQ